MRIAIIGLGTLGGILARALLDCGVAAPDTMRGAVAHADNARAIASQYPFPVCDATGVPAMVGDAEIVILAVKPYAAEAVLKSAGVRADQLVISVCAGVTTQQLEACVPDGTPVIRSMPNTPAAVGAGMTVICAGRAATEAHVATARQLFETCGRCVALDERHMDIVTGLSASGPAFIYVIIESLAEGGVMAGLPRNVATEITAQAVLGAARMVIETGHHPAALKDAVTTPAGCTITGILALEDGRLRSTLARAVVDTARRAGELSRPQ